MKRLLPVLVIGLLCISMFSMLAQEVRAQAATLPWRDDFDYNTLDEMKAAGWTLSREEKISVGGGVVTLDNDGAQGSAIHYTKGFASGVYDFKVETRSRWVGRTYGHNGNSYVYTQRHHYSFWGDGYYHEYAFQRDDNWWFFGDYTPIMNAWTTFTLEKKGNTFYMYQDGELKYTYVESDDAPDEIVRVDISCGWISTMQYDYISVERVHVGFEDYARLAEGRAEAYATYASAVYYYAREQDFDTQLVRQAFADLNKTYKDLLELELAPNLGKVAVSLKLIIHFKEYLDSLEERIIEVIDWMRYGAAANRTYVRLKNIESLCRQEADAWRSGDLNGVKSVLEEEEGEMVYALPEAKGFQHSAHKVDENGHQVAESTLAFVRKESHQIGKLREFVEKEIRTT